MNRNWGHSPVCIWRHLTRTWPLTGKESPEREQSEIPGFLQEWLAGKFYLKEIHTKAYIYVKGK